MCWQFALCLLYVGTVVVHAGTDVPDVPVGHLQKLGSHRPMEGRVEVLDKVPHPIELYEQYSAVSKPVILKGAARDMPAFKLWTDDYMKEKYGKLNVQIEPGKKENRTRVAIEGTSSSFGEFLDIYPTSDIYMVDDVPEPMKEEMMILQCLLCGGYTNFLSLQNMWFSNGGTKSVLHTDPGDNMNCLLSGRKEFFMAHKEFGPKLPWSSIGHIPIDVDAVDLIATPEIKQVKWWLAEVEAGDCLFIPNQWLHQVRSYDRNLAVNIWWHFFYKFNYTDCLTGPADEGADPPSRKDLPQYRPFSENKVLAGETHRMSFAMGMHEQDTKAPKPFRKRALGLFCLEYAQSASSQSGETGKKGLENAVHCARELMRLGDKNGDKRLDVDELYAIDASVFVDLFGEPVEGYGMQDEEEPEGEDDDLDVEQEGDELPGAERDNESDETGEGVEQPEEEAPVLSEDNHDEL